MQGTCSALGVTNTGPNAWARGRETNLYKHYWYECRSQGRTVGGRAARPISLIMIMIVKMILISLSLSLYIYICMYTKHICVYIYIYISLSLSVCIYIYIYTYMVTAQEELLEGGPLALMSRRSLQVEAPDFASQSSGRRGEIQVYIYI